VHEADELGEIRIEACDRVPHFGTLVGRRRGGVVAAGEADAVGQRPSAPLAARVVEHGSPGDAEQPHARTLGIGRQFAHPSPRHDHGLAQQIGRVVESDAPLQKSQQIAGCLTQRGSETCVVAGHGRPPSPPQSSPSQCTWLCAVDPASAPRS
jgi:hypothetical protein